MHLVLVVYHLQNPMLRQATPKPQPKQCSGQLVATVDSVQCIFVESVCQKSFCLHEVLACHQWTRAQAKPQCESDATIRKRCHNVRRFVAEKSPHTGTHCVLKLRGCFSGKSLPFPVHCQARNEYMKTSCIWNVVPKPMASKVWNGVQKQQSLATAQPAQQSCRQASKFTFRTRVC